MACAIGMRGSSPRMTAALRAGDEIRRQPVPDCLGDDLDGVVFGVALRALLGEPLLRTGNVVVDMGMGAVGDGGLAGRELDQLEARIDGIDLGVRPPGGGVEV